jgi:protein-disulfide isomerase
MINISRRNLLLGISLLGFAPLTALPAIAADKVDLSDILTPPDEGDMTMGKDDAKVTMVEYASASCPHCAAFYKDVFPKIKADYIDTGKIRFIFREFPHNQQALAAFMLARCSPKEKYFPLMDVFFSTQETWVPNAHDGLLNIMKQAGMSQADFDACLKNEKIAKAILAVRDKASNKYGVDGIPTIFINGQVFHGEATYDDIKKVIDPLLN